MAAFAAPPLFDYLRVPTAIKKRDTFQTKAKVVVPLLLSHVWQFKTYWHNINSTKHQNIYNQYDDIDK